MRRHASGRRWTVGDVFWLLVPVVSILGVAGYFTASIMLGSSPPFSVVSGHSMLPTMSPGDLVVIKGVPAKDVRAGDVLSITTPEKDRTEKDLPAEIVHRVVERRGTGADLTFITKGDNNPGEDAFVTRAGDIRGEVVKTIPGLGYPVLFFRSHQGRIFLGALGLAILGYFVIAALERRQEAAELESPTRAVEELGAEIERLREAVTAGVVPAGAGPPELEELVAAQRHDRETMNDLVSAVREYGEHLRSHTQAVKSMADAAQELAKAADQIRASLAQQQAPPTEAPPTTAPEARTPPATPPPVIPREF